MLPDFPNLYRMLDEEGSALAGWMLGKAHSSVRMGSFTLASLYLRDALESTSQ